MSQPPLRFEGVGAPTLTALQQGFLDDDPDLPIDIRAARAWHRGMVRRGVASHPYLASLRSYVRFAINDAARENPENPNLTEAVYRLRALLAYADAGTDPTVGLACADCGAIVFDILDTLTHFPDDPDHGGWDPIVVDDTNRSL